MMYRLTSTNWVQRVTDGAYIPADPSNQDWQAYQEWLGMGHEPEEPAPAPQPTAQEQIDALEREHMAPRWMRDFTLGSMEREAVDLGSAQGLSAEQSIALLRTKNAGYRRLKELDELIATLRATQ